MLLVVQEQLILVVVVAVAGILELPVNGRVVQVDLV